MIVSSEQQAVGCEQKNAAISTSATA